MVRRSRLVVFYDCKLYQLLRVWLKKTSKTMNQRKKIWFSVVFFFCFLVNLMICMFNVVRCSNIATLNDINRVCFLLFSHSLSRVDSVCAFSFRHIVVAVVLKKETGFKQHHVILVVFSQFFLRFLFFFVSGQLSLCTSLFCPYSMNYSILLIQFLLLRLSRFSVSFSAFDLQIRQLFIQFEGGGC